MPSFGTSASRLRKHADYQRVYSSSRKQFSKQMSFFFCVRATEDVAGPRVGLTVGKVMGKAVDRNRIKRRLREVVRKNAPALRLLPVDVILHPRRAVIDLDFELLDREVANVFRTIQRTVQARAQDGAPNHARDRAAKQQPAVPAPPAAQ
jgi:ribonuclease P protein component